MGGHPSICKVFNLSIDDIAESDPSVHKGYPFRGGCVCASDTLIFCPQHSMDERTPLLPDKLITTFDSESVDFTN